MIIYSKFKYVSLNVTLACISISWPPLNNQSRWACSFYHFKLIWIHVSQVGCVNHHNRSFICLLGNNKKETVQSIILSLSTARQQSWMNAFWQIQSLEFCAAKERNITHYVMVCMKGISSLMNEVTEKSHRPEDLKEMIHKLNDLKVLARISNKTFLWTAEIQSSTNEWLIFAFIKLIIHFPTPTWAYADNPHPQIRHGYHYGFG